MRKIFVLMAAMALTLGMVGVASAEEHGQPWPEHGHIMLLHAEWTGVGSQGTLEITSYKKCVDLAGGNKNDRAHHTTIHTGRAGQALAGAGHLVLPTTGITPFANCADFAENFFPFPPSRPS